jgi:hypothetical protein
LEYLNNVPLCFVFAAKKVSNNHFGLFFKCVRLRTLKIVNLFIGIIINILACCRVIIEKKSLSQKQKLLRTLN